MPEPMNEEVDQAPDPESIEFPPDVDTVLAFWLNRFEALGMSTDVTLTVGGFVIAGSTQTFSEFYREVGKGFESGMSRTFIHGDDGIRTVDLSEVGRKFRELLDEVAAQFEVPKPDPDDPESESKRDAAKEEIMKTPRRMIHLKNVVMLTPSGEYRNAPYWRGRLGHVSGWYFGRPSDMMFEAVDD